MTGAQVQELIVETIRSPSTAAARILQVTLSQEWLWMALVLMSVLNAIVYSVSLWIAPPPDAASGGLIIPPAFQSPVLFTMFLFGALVMTIFVLYWIGRAMGGQGSLRDILILITWLQVLRLLLQVAVLVFSLVLPGLAALLVLVGSVWGIYIVAAFLNVAHRFGSVWKAAGVLLIAFLAIAVSLSMFLGSLGAIMLGGTGRV